MEFRFRIFSTITTQVAYTNSQDKALRILHTSRSLDRVDYKCVGDWHGWRYVDTEILQKHSILHIYQVDSRFDRLRAALYCAVGLAFASMAALIYLNR